MFSILWFCEEKITKYWTLKNQTLNIPSKWLNGCIVSKNRIKRFFKYHRVYMFCPVLASAKGGKPGCFNVKRNENFLALDMTYRVQKHAFFQWFVIVRKNWFNIVVIILIK